MLFSSKTPSHNSSVSPLCVQQPCVSIVKTHSRALTSEISVLWDYPTVTSHDSVSSLVILSRITCPEMMKMIGSERVTTALLMKKTS